MSRVDALLIHDLDPGHLGIGDGVANAFGQLAQGGFDALANLKARDEILAAGAGVNRVGMIPQFLTRFACVKLKTRTGTRNRCDFSIQANRNRPDGQNEHA
jgi:hypothetical protein